MVGSGGSRSWSSWWSWMLVVVLCSFVTMQVLQVGAVPALPPEDCKEPGGGCTLYNAYRLWNDRSDCKVAKVVYPTTEKELVAVVAEAARQNQKIKVTTAYGHSITKVACPGGEMGLIVSSRNMTAFVNVNKTANVVTVQSGITMRALGDGLAAYGLALPVSSAFDGVTVGGVLANSVTGSSLWGKGSALHEYVLAVRLVTPASAEEGWATVREIDIGDPDLDAARVNLGVLGVLSTVTLQVEPQFKRSVTLEVVNGDDDLTGAKVVDIAKRFQYGEIYWYPALRQIVYKYDNRVPVTTPGDGRNNFFGFQPQLLTTVEADRAADELAEFWRNREAECLLARTFVSLQQAIAYGFEHQSSPQGIPNPNFFPVTGNQNYMMNGGGCQRSQNPLEYCGWDTRINGLVFFEAGAALPLSNIQAFIDDVRLLRSAAPPGSMCNMDMYTGIMFRFVPKSRAYLSTAQEDTVTMDFAWTRGNNNFTARLDMDVFQELEQLAFEKHGARPHWGKNRNAIFKGAWLQYPQLEKFLDVKQRFDPAGLFSSEWSDAILGLGASNAFSEAPFCAIEGNCKCSRDEHCAPQQGYFCRPGLVYPDARVCRYESKTVADQ